MTQTAYGASIKVGKFSWGDFVIAICGGLILLGVVPISIVLLLNFLNLAIVALIVAGLAALFMIGLSLGIRLTSHGELHKRQVEGKLDSEFGMVVSSFISLILLFSLVCKEIHLNYHDQFHGAGSMELSLWMWCLYSIDNFAECIFFDVPSIYDLHVTSITPIAGLSRFVAIAFRLTIDFLLISSIVHYAEFLRARGKFGGATPAPSPGYQADS